MILFNAANVVLYINNADHTTSTRTRKIRVLAPLRGTVASQSNNTLATAAEAPVSKEQTATVIETVTDLIAATATSSTSTTTKISTSTVAEAAVLTKQTMTVIETATNLIATAIATTTIAASTATEAAKQSTTVVSEE